MNQKMINKLIRYTLIGLGIAVFGLALTVFFQYKQLQTTRIFSRVDEKIQVELNKLTLFKIEKRIRKEGIFPPHNVAEVKVDVPLSYPLDDLLRKAKNGFNSPEIQVLGFREENTKDTYKFYLDAGQDGFLTHKLIFSLKKAKIALLIDDFGYTNDDRLINTFFQEIPVPLTISIIPGTHFAEKIAKEAHRQKKQILVHLPMQPRGKFVNRYKWIILKGMSGEKIEEIAREAIESIPYAQGLNNHMGSLATTQKELMEPLLQVLKEKKMFFVDSRTSPSSIGYSLARKLGVKSTFNCVFLDNKKEESYIENQFKKLLSKAIEKGWALGLGHSNIETALALKKLVKECDNRKVNFVFCSDILN